MGKNISIADEKSIAKIFTDYFTSIIKHLHIERNEFDPKQVKLFNNRLFSSKQILKSLKHFENQIKRNFLWFHFLTSKL